MDFLTAAVLSGITYEAIKNGLAFTADLIKSELEEWLIDDEVALAVSKELEKLELTDELSEKAVERRISESAELISLIQLIKPATEGNQIIQNHHGSGDNVGRDKIIHK